MKNNGVQDAFPNITRSHNTIGETVFTFNIDQVTIIWEDNIAFHTHVICPYITPRASYLLALAHQTETSLRW